MDKQTAQSEDVCPDSCYLFLIRDLSNKIANRMLANMGQPLCRIPISINAQPHYPPPIASPIAHRQSPIVVCALIAITDQHCQHCSAASTKRQSYGGYSSDSITAITYVSNSAWERERAKDRGSQTVIFSLLAGSPVTAAAAAAASTASIAIQ